MRGYSAGVPNPLVIPAGYAQCVFGAEDSYNLRSVSFSIGAHLGSTEASLASNLAGWFGGSGGSDFRTSCSQQFFLTQVEVVGHSTSAVSSIGVFALSTAPQLPDNTTAKVRKLTGIRGKANKGYMFPYGLVPRGSISDSGGYSSAFVTGMNTVFAALLTAMSTDGSSPEVLHRTNSSVTTPTPITALSFSPSAHTQRRRLEPRH